MELKVQVEFKGGLFSGNPKRTVADNLTAAMYEATLLLEREVKSRTPRGVYGNKGGLASGIAGEVIGKGTPQVKGIVASHATHAYAEVIEKGRRAGKTWPPEGSLIRWIKVKMGVDTQTAKKMEFVIRRKIGQKGFPGAHMFEESLNKNMSRIQKIFDEAGFKIARALD